MVAFELELELENKPLKISVEQLDRLADAEGFIRFDVTAGEHRSVIYVNVENDLPLVTPQDAEAYFEAVNYPSRSTPSARKRCSPAMRSSPSAAPSANITAN